MPHITAKYIETEVQNPCAGQVIIRDDELKGFGLRVTKTCMSFIAEHRQDGRVRRVTLGKYGTMMPEEARREARKILLVAEPSVVIQSCDKTTITLHVVLEQFLAVRKLRPNTIRTYSQVTKRCLGDWLQYPVTKITKDMIQSRHRDLTKPTKQGSSGEAQANMAMRILRALLNFAANNYENPHGEPIINVNPVCRLSQNRSWHAEHRRRIILPDNKLGSWYRAVVALKQTTTRDYLIFLLLTGLRKNEAATLRWTDVDLEARTITIRAECTKNKQEHCLPLTDFLTLMLNQRQRDSAFVFPGRGGRSHLVDPGHILQHHVVKNSGCSFVIHDLRRSFITMAAKLGVAHHIIKKLVNHISSSGATDGYIVIQVEHLCEPMALINNRFLTLFGCDISDWRQSDEIAS